MIFQRDDLSRVICNIRIPLGGVENVGTGVFIGKDEQLYLVTAAHVVKNLNVNTYVIISGNTGNPMRIPLNTLLQGGAFENHPTADLAKARINMTYFNRHLLESRFFPYGQVDLSDNLVSKDLELTTIGFPMGLGSTGAKFSPLSYRTHVSSPAISLHRFDKVDPPVVNDFIILEMPSIGGYSGGPLFDLGYSVGRGMVSSGRQTTLHGIVHGTISDETGGKLAAVTPLKYLNGWL